MSGAFIPDPKGGLVTIHGHDADGNPVAIRVTASGFVIMADFAPTDAQYVVLALDGDLDNESLHSALSGADLHNPKAHKALHQDGGADEISVAALSGELADAQPPKAHDLGGAEHNADTLADLNNKVSDATLDDSSATRTPSGHKASHAGGGADKLKYTRQLLWFDVTAAIATGSDKSATIVYRGPTLTLVRWDMRAKTAPTGTTMIFDVNVAGTSLWASTQANRPTIAISANSGTGTSFDTTTLSDGDVLTLDYDQIGSGTAGGQVTLILEGEANLETD